MSIITEKQGRVGKITLNRPEVLNALSQETIDAIKQALTSFEADDGIGAIIITGSEKAFAAGVDVTEMKDLTFPDVYVHDFLEKGWEALAKCKKPVICAVAGYALGGGCELAMMGDIILAADNAQFGQPESGLGIIPGIGGTQRLTALVGKAMAMDMCLSGRRLTAHEALQAGLVSRVVPLDELQAVAMEVAEAVASQSLPVTMMVKEAITQSQEMGLQAGIRFERRLFHSCFAMHDQKEGMTAFTEKRKATFKNA
ncbi:MAG: enoyl-CoA hydratase-related protein [Alphaproteobacteria bacterium]